MQILGRFLYLHLGEQLGVQVSYNMIDQDTRKHEISALVKLNAFKPLKRSVIITYNEESSVVIGNQTIEIIPVWKWMLELLNKY